MEKMAGAAVERSAHSGSWSGARSLPKPPGLPSWHERAELYFCGMAYVLNAFVGPAVTLSQQITWLPDTRLVLLEQGLAMAPIVYKIGRPTQKLQIVSPFWKIPQELFQLGLNLSVFGPIGYFEIEFFGGAGEQASVLW